MAKKPILVRGLIPRGVSSFCQSWTLYPFRIYPHLEGIWMIATPADLHGEAAQRTRGANRERLASIRAAILMAHLWAKYESGTFLLLAMCTGATLCWAATATAWALLSIIGTLGCHRRWQML